MSGLSRDELLERLLARSLSDDGLDWGALARVDEAWLACDRERAVREARRRGWRAGLLSLFDWRRRRSAARARPAAKGKRGGL